MRRLAAALILALALPAAVAAQSGKPPRVGFLILSSLSSASGVTGLEGFRAQMRELGHVEGRTFTMEPRSAEGRADRLPVLAAELIASKVDVIVTGGGNVSALSARKATATIPIVMSGGVGAVEAGLIESLGRPGGNVTGLNVPRELGAKQVELLRELLPSMSRVVVLLRTNFTLAAERSRVRAAAQQFGLTLDYAEVSEPEDLFRALAAARASRPSAMLVGPDPVFFQYRDRIIEFARAARVPTMYPFRDFVESGGLISYSLSAHEAYRGVARYVDRILRGARPADLPVEEPSKYELLINLKTARALGLTIPPSLLLRADEVIE